MVELGIGVELDLSGDRLVKLIPNAEKDKIPMIGVLGAKEVETNFFQLTAEF